MEAEKKSRFFSGLLYNWVSISGFALGIIGLITSILLFLLDLMSEESPAYLGVVFLLFLTMILMGLVLVPVGMILERRNIARGAGRKISGRWVIDLRLPAHRNTLMVFFVGAVVVTLSLVAGSYRAYKATESNDFCGQLCHEVMSPEFTTYHYSSHARVKCVECHIGSGAGWFVRSKVSGLTQVIAVLLNNFPRPIPTPIKNLRPARETCENCHWPSKFIGFKEFVRSYYMSDEKNSEHQIRMLMKIGGEKSKLVRGSGIHYHMLIAGKIEYIARDEKRQEIAWVKMNYAEGGSTEFNDEDDPLTEEERKSLSVRTMDCMDCHNRPSHKFPTPMESVNSSIEQGLINTELPFIKREATRALDQDYKTTEAAMTGIFNHLRVFYHENRPDVISEKDEMLNETIKEVQRIYRRSIFPEMKSNWAAYPDNIGHKDWPGCFRCHNDRMVSADETTIFTTCNKCHLILAQGKNVEQATQVNFMVGLDFLHPGDSEYVEDYYDCTDCHSGGAGIYD